MDCSTTAGSILPVILKMVADGLMDSQLALYLMIGCRFGWLVVGLDGVDDEFSYDWIYE